MTGPDPANGVTLDLCDTEGKIPRVDVTERCKHARKATPA